MIPLRTPATLQKFPTSLFIFLAISLILTALFSQAVSSSDSLFVKVLVSTLIFPSKPLGLLCVWYMWIFFPSFLLREARSVLLDLFFPFIALAISIVLIKFQILAAVSLIYTMLIFGAVMRNLIWENVDTLVFGPKLFSVYAVPSYVHVFFFLFYLFLCQLWRPAYGLPDQSIYLVSLISFIVGFLIRTLELKGLKDRET